MSSRPPVPKYARNKNMLVVGGSGSGKTRFVLKPNLLQCCSKKYPVSFVITDPKGSIVNESAHALVVNGYEIRIFNTINFHKSMHYNPFAYIHDEKDILKLVTTLMANTKGEGNGGDPFWEKSEKLLYTALIGYIHYEAPVEEQNFATLLEMLNTGQSRTPRPAGTSLRSFPSDTRQAGALRRRQCRRSDPSDRGSEADFEMPAAASRSERYPAVSPMH